MLQLLTVIQPIKKYHAVTELEGSLPLPLDPILSKFNPDVFTTCFPKAHT
jgi:hypothetical protein